MSKYFILSIDALVNTFSVVKSGIVFDFSIQTPNQDNSSSNLQTNDKVLALVDNSITYGFDVIRSQVDKVVLKKVFEIAKGLDLENIAIGRFEEITEEIYNDICFRLFSDFKEITAHKTYSKGKQINFDVRLFKKALENAGLTFSESLITRFTASLCTKPFVILTGLSGSGKTKLAQAFVQWICESEKQYKIVPVGADWTNREPLLGYPNGLNPIEYILPDIGALQILIESNKPENSQKPYFLILDEMNLSHVERYFADFLSVMESHKSIKLYDGLEREMNNVKIEKEISWPGNLFIIGTVNVDETTYMFSPKVLDRANVIEFRIDVTEMNKFLEDIPKLEMNKLHAEENESNPGLGASMAADFLNLAGDKEVRKTAVDSLTNFFPVLQKTGAEFGYRTASEINRLVGILEIITKELPDWNGNKIKEDAFIDIAIMQKLLPKLHGSRNRLVPVLVELGRLCIVKIDERYSTAKDKDGKQFISEFFEKEVSDDNILYKLSFDKIRRMYKNLISNGFTSYAEA